MAPKGPKQNEAADPGSLVVHQLMIFRMCQRMLGWLGSLQMSTAAVSFSAPQPPSPPAPEIGAISTTDHGHSLRVKTGRQHESCRIVAIGLQCRKDCREK